MIKIHADRRNFYKVENYSARTRNSLGPFIVFGK